VAVNPAGTRVYVTNFDAHTVSVIDTASNTIVGAPIPVGTEPLGVAVNPAGTRVYVTHFDADTISVIDTATNSVTATIPVGRGPIALGQFISPGAALPPAAIPALSPLGHALFVFVVFSSGLVFLRRRLSSSG